MATMTTPEPSSIHRGSPDYPPALEYALGRLAPDPLAAIGDPALLRRPTLALLCSARCPGSLLVQVYDLARSLRDRGVTVVSGFHSPIEKDCLPILLRGDQPIVICPARSLAGMRLPADWQTALTEGRLLVLSPFPEKYRRATAGLAQERNEFVAALADQVLIAHAAEGSRLIALAETALGWAKPVLTLPDPVNAPLFRLGARPIDPAG